MFYLLYDYNHAIRYTFGKISYDELRSYLAYKLRNSIAHVPNEQAIPKFLKGLFGIGLVREVTQVKAQIFKSFKDFNKFYFSLIKTHKKSEKEIRKFVMSSPLFIAYRNKNISAFETLNDFLINPSLTKIQETMMNLRYDDFDALVATHREKSRSVDFVSKVWSRAFNILFIKDISYMKTYNREILTTLNSCNLYELEVGFFKNVALGGLMQEQLQERQIKSLIQPFIFNKDEEEYTPKYRIRPY